jgi:hypothetical protein
VIKLDRRDAEHLIAQPEFLRFLGAAIQAAGILGHHGAANGQLTRDLGHFEGRRSLGFDLLLMAHSGQPEAIRAADPTGMTTLTSALRSVLNPSPTGKPNDRRNRDTARYATLEPDTDA